MRHHLGYVDATREPVELRESFVYTPQYEDLRQRDRCFVAGRRGSGKSAHALMLADKWPIATLCSDPDSQFERYQDIVEILINMQREGATVNIQRCMQSLWVHTLRVLIFQTLVANREKLHRPEMADPFRQYLEERAINSATLGQVLMRAFKPASERAAGSVKQAGLTLVDELGELEADRGARTLFEQLPSILGSQRMLILVDSLERYAIFRAEMQEALGGIARAIVGLKANRAATGVDIRFFMPAEIFEYISPEMPGKVLGETVFLRWRFHHLLAMLTIRYLEMLRRNDLEEAPKIAALQAQVHEALKSDTAMRNLRKEFWYANHYLPSHVVNNLGGREDTFAYVLRHTQRRPRELIYVLNQILDEANRREELPRISPEAVRIGLHAPVTLQFLVRDSLSPFAAPDRNMVDMARIIFHEHQRVFTARDVLRWAKRLRDLDKLQDATEESVIQELLRSGVIGQVERDTEHYTIARFEYLMQDHLELIVEHTQEYCVHPTVADFFRMETPKNKKVIYPLPEADEWLESDLGIVR